MNKQIFSSLILIVCVVALVPGCRRSRTEVARTAEQAVTSISPPAWLSNEPLVVVGNWDSMPIFRRRVGGNPVWQEDDYRKEHSEETVRRLKELGVSLAVIHFYKGFGLQAEKAQLDDARKLAALLKANGIRVGVYVGSTIAYETFLAEKPEAESWFVPDYLGKPVFYDDQTFRKRVYFMHPGYREYMKRVLRVAVEELKVDEIDFDNTSVQGQPPIFLHPLAIEDFRKFLAQRYSPEMLTKRFGFAEVRFMQPPRYDKPLGSIDDPLFQEWADFRCRQLNRYYAELADHIRAMNRDVAIATNPHSGISGRNTVWDQGVDYPTLVPYMDIVWTEEGNEATVNEAGILVSKIRTYKMATSLGRRIITYTAGTRGGKLQMAESMAFNRQSLGMVGGVLAGYDLPEDQREYIRFFRRNFEQFKDVKNIADVAVLHTHASMGFSNDRPWQSTMLFEQALIQAKVPFDVIFDDQLKDLSRYKALVLADQECLSDAQLDLIRTFVNNGGGLVATEHSSLYTEWRQRRADFGLRDLFGVQAPPWAGRRAMEALTEVKSARLESGKGRVAYIREVTPAIAKPASVPMTSQYWALPLNHAALIAEVKWAAGGFTMDVEAPLTVVAEVQESGNGAFVVHLLNYGVERAPLVRNIGISLRLPPDRNAAKVRLLSPDGPAGEASGVTARGGRLEFRVPALRTYTLALVQPG